jgi:hypothetical protein
MKKALTTPTASLRDFDKRADGILAELQKTLLPEHARQSHFLRRPAYHGPIGTAPLTAVKHLFLAVRMGEWGDQPLARISA